MKPFGRRKCVSCRKLFVPDARNRRHQRCCGKASCRQERKAASDRRWRGKPQNREYWSGPENTARVRAWQKAHPGYWKRRKKKARVLQVVCAPEAFVRERDNSKVLQDVWRMQPPLLLGPISKITGTVLHTDMAEITGQLIANGRALVGPNH
jgi:hypothetical protein